MNPIETAFYSANFQVTKTNNNVYQIRKSDSLVTRIAEQIIKATGHFPLISENRIDGNIEFTVIPYTRPETFNKFHCPTAELSYTELWETIESTQSLLKENRPVICQGKLVFNTPAEGEIEMTAACTKPASFLLDFFDRAPTSGRALDIGCGHGLNSISLLEKGWEVIALDKLSISLDLYQEMANGVNQTFLKTGKLRLIKEDITLSNLEISAFDAVICIDVLPYINSKKLKSVIEKIYSALVPGGYFFGTLFFSTPGNEQVEELMKKLGAHFYPNPSITQSFLQHSGFNVEECSIRLSSKSTTECVQFSAKKSE